MSSPTIIDSRLRKLQGGKIRLDRSSHHSFADGHCAMEVVAWLAGEGHTDAPACASPLLTRFTIRLNDRWSTEQRQALIPFLPRMVGTAGDGLDDARMEIARQALTGDLLAPWLRLAGMDAEADAISTANLTDLRALLDSVRAAAWRRRDQALAPIREKVRAAVREKLAERPAVAAAVAAAAADTDAVADAVAVAVAVADTAAVADAVAAGTRSGSYWPAYHAARTIFAKAIEDCAAPKLIAIRDLAAAQRGMALDLLDRMIKPEVSY